MTPEGGTKIVDTGGQISVGVAAIGKERKERGGRDGALNDNDMRPPKVILNVRCISFGATLAV